MTMKDRTRRRGINCHQTYVTILQRNRHYVLGRKRNSEKKGKRERAGENPPRQSKKRASWQLRRENSTFTGYQYWGLDLLRLAHRKNGRGSQRDQMRMKALQNEQKKIGKVEAGDQRQKMEDGTVRGTCFNECTRTRNLQTVPAGRPVS